MIQKMNEIEKNEEPQLNVDYILTLERENDNFLINKRQIERTIEQKTLLRNLYGVQDPLDVIKFFPSIGNKREYYYCWPYSYSEAFINTANIPESTEEKTKYLQGINNIIENREKEIYKKSKLKSLKNIVYRYIYAECYFRTLTQIKNTVLMYSSDMLGWYKPKFVVTDDVTIALYTNFCYGSSSYFYIGLCYKGIQILPYDDIVNYYWSRMMDNIRYTVDYNPERSNWENALLFVKEISEMIMRDPQKFEQVWIVERVGKMMHGLKQINDNIIQFYSVQKQKSEDESKTENKVYRYRNISQEEIKCCEIYKDEQLLTIQVDKFSAALGFLSELMSLKTIYVSVLKHIETILNYNLNIVKPIENCAEKVEMHLLSLNTEKDILEKEQDKLEQKLQQREDEIKNDLKNIEFADVEDMSTELQNRCNTDECYAQIKKTLRKKREELKEMYNLIWMRERFKEHLIERKKFILDKIKEYNFKSNN